MKIEKPKPSIEAARSYLVRFAVRFAFAMRHCKSGIGLVLRITEQLTARHCQLDQERGLRTALRLLLRPSRPAPRLPFKRRRDRHLDDRQARGAVDPIALDHVVKVPEAGRRLCHADFDAFLDQRWADLVDRLAAGTVLV